MKKAFALFALLALFGFAPLAHAQDPTPKVELYTGYDYLCVNINANVPGFSTSASFNGNGGGGNLEYNVNHWFGLVGDLAGYYFAAEATGGAFSYLFGPRINFRHGNVTPFAHVLLGGIATTSGIGQFGPQNQFAMAAGGGLDIKVSRHFAIRPVQAEYFLSKIPDGLNNRQNNFRFSAGIVFRFGG
ncbi:MAG: outer membrane beta-barrel protein [Candidatus Acidiferrales bacterium]